MKFVRISLCNSVNMFCAQRRVLFQLLLMLSFPSDMFKLSLRMSEMMNSVISSSQRSTSLLFTQTVLS